MNTYKYPEPGHRVKVTATGREGQLASLESRGVNVEVGSQKYFYAWYVHFEDTGEVALYDYEALENLSI